ncbi:hypothetical protein BH18GEM1_BH18GEM1_22390 [soil metagenome]
MLLGWWFLDEPVTWRLAIGGVTILAGLLLLYFARVREDVREVQPVPGEAAAAPADA